MVELMRLYSYIVAHDSGFSPNPFWGCCTLADCKPWIRRTAKVGDWIVGLSPKTKGYRIVYAMRVDEILDYARYYRDPRFVQKIPDYGRGIAVHRRGDNIYEPLADGQFRQLRSRHSNDDGSENLARKATDLTGRNAIVGRRFYYFGASGPPLPENLDDLIVGRGHKNSFSKEIIARFVEFITSQPEGINARPTRWRADDDSWRLGRG
jgi:hypothetical protein